MFKKIEEKLSLVKASSYLSVSRLSDLLNDKLIVATILLVSWLCYAHTVTFEFFIFDDYHYILDNIFFKNLSIGSLIDPWLQSRTPVVFNFWQVIALLFGLDNPAPFRLLNILLHMANSVMVYFLIKSIFRTMYKESEKLHQLFLFSAAAGALLFSVHPIQVESVVWISSLRGLLAAFFALLSFNFYFYVRLNQFDRRRAFYWTIAIFVTFALGLLSKPSIVSLPILFVLFDLYLFKQKSITALFNNLIYFLIVAVGLIMHVIHPDAMNIVGKSDPMPKRLIIALDSLRVTVVNLVAPFGLSFDYQLNPATFLEYFSGNVVGHSWKFMFFLVVSWLVVYFAWGRRHTIFFVALGIFLSFFLVHSGIVPFVFQNISTVANRYAYLPIIGVCLFFAGLIFKGQERYPLITNLLGGATLLLFTVLCLFEGAKWYRSEILLESNYQKHKTSYPLNVSLSTAYRARGDLDKAIFYMEAAKLTNPTDKMPYVELISLYLAKNDDKKLIELIAEIEKSFEFIKDELDIAIAEAEFKSMRFSSANFYLERYIDSPDVPTHYAHKALKLRDRLGEVLNDFMPEAYRRIGMLFYTKGELVSAKVWLELSLSLFPNPKLESFIRYVDYKIKNPKDDEPTKP